MNVKEVIQSQYLASLEMLKSAISLCPEPLWEDPKPQNKFWHIAYHALFYTHLYLQPKEANFKPWDKHREESGSLSWNPQDPPTGKALYSKDDLLEYLDFCQAQVKTIVPNLDLESVESGFHWLPFGKLELQFYNIRHLQQHTGELCERLGREAGIDVGWVGRMQP